MALATGEQADCWLCHPAVIPISPVKGETREYLLAEAHTKFTRIGVSGMLKSGDVVVGVHNRRGDLVSASCGTYLHGPVAQLPVKFLIHQFLETESNVSVNPGDIFYANEALAGGVHNHDQMAIMPIFHDEELIGWATAALHQAETGAISSGMPGEARTRYEEGMRLTPIKIAENYEIRDDLMDMMKNFIMRAPEMQETDVHARCTTVDIIRKRIQMIAEETSAEFVHGLFQSAIEEAETGARSIISSLNDGTYRAVSFLDTVGAEETLVKIALTLEKSGEEIHLDFSGTSPQAGSYNSFAHAVPGYMASYLFPYIFYDLPVSTGAFAPFSFDIPDRSILNADPESSVALCVFTGTVVLGLCHDAFSRMLYATHPERVAAAPDTINGGGFASYGIGTNKYGIQQTNMGAFGSNTRGGGARVDKDGVDAYGFNYAPWGKSRNFEETEDEGICLTFVGGRHPDLGGPGKHRGGNGTQTIKIVTTDRSVSGGGGGSNEKGVHLPNATGLFGGYGEASLFSVRILDTDILERFEKGEDVPTDIPELLSERPIEGEYQFHDEQDVREYERGTVLLGMSGGGGGLGDPIERDPSVVEEDLTQGLTREWTARNVYHVVNEDGDVDDDATEHRRARERKNRIRRGRSFEAFQQEWQSKRPPREILENYGEWPDGLVETGSIAVSSDM